MSNQKVWFITGASQRMRLEVAKAVLANGDKVVATSRSLEKLLLRELICKECYLLFVKESLDQFSIPLE